MRSDEVNDNLSDLATNEQMSASTHQNQALTVLLFLYRELLGQTLVLNFDV